ncbi:MAG: M13-type metalloendopeptidase [Nocardioides sp.]
MSILDDARPGMNLDIRPQDDLFGHVNGTWLEETEIPADRSAWGPFAYLADQAEEQVRAIIEELSARAADGAELDADAAKIARLHRSFMDTDAIAARGLSSVREVLDEVDRLADLAGLAAFLGRQERTGLAGLFGSYIDTDDKDSDRYLVHLVQGGLGLPDESYYREDKFAEVRDKYVDYLTRMLELAGRPGAAEAARRVLEIETRLAQGHWERAETRDVQKSYNLTSRAALGELAPGFDWDGYVAALGGGAHTLAETVVKQPSYLAHLSQVLGEVPVEDWRHYLAVRVLRAAAPYLTDDFVETNFDFYGRTLNGTPELRARWKRGVAFVEGAIGEAVGREYVARHFPPTSKAMMDELVANLLTAYRQSISVLDWMGEETKQRAYEKLETFRPKIGYPDRFRDYSALEVAEGDLLANAAAAAAFETDRQLAKIGAPVDRDEWFMLPQTVNAYYNPGTNEICFPAGILQKPFFSPDAHPAENYGGIGAVIGHEIGHGFDDQGRSSTARATSTTGGRPMTRRRSRSRARRSSSSTTTSEPRNLPGERVNGALTVGENIGDLGGLTIGYQAYLISQGGQTSVEDSQRVFLNWAYCWRSLRRKEQELQLLTIDPHSPAEFRANIVRNLDEFHSAFGTQEGDGLWLDPARRVRIW